MKIKLNPDQEIVNMKRNMAFRWMESEADPGWGGLYESDIFFEIILTKFIKIDMMVLTISWSGLSLIFMFATSFLFIDCGFIIPQDKAFFCDEVTLRQIFI